MSISHHHWTIVWSLKSLILSDMQGLAVGVCGLGRTKAFRNYCMIEGCQDTAARSLRRLNTLSGWAIHIIVLP